MHSGTLILVAGQWTIKTYSHVNKSKTNTEEEEEEEEKEEGRGVE